jgi:hypothetical protein
MDKSVVRTSQDLVIIELKTCNDMCRVSLEGKVMWCHFPTHPAMLEHVMPTIERLEEMQFPQAR